MIFTTDDKTLFLYNTETLYYDEVRVTDDLKMTVLRRDLPFKALDYTFMRPADDPNVRLTNFGSVVLRFKTRLPHPNHPDARVYMLFHVATNHWSVDRDEYALEDAFAPFPMCSPWMHLIHVGFEGVRVKAHVLNRVTGLSGAVLARAHVRKRTVFIESLEESDYLPLGEVLDSYEAGDYELGDVYVLDGPEA